MKDIGKRERYLLAAIGFLLATLLGMVLGRVVPENSSLGDWSSFASAVAAFVAIGLAFFGYLEAAEANKREHRAYVQITVARAWHTDRNVIVELNITNHGKTPALGLECVVKARIGGARASDSLQSKTPKEPSTTFVTEIYLDRFFYGFVSMGSPQVVRIMFDHRFSRTEIHSIGGEGILYIQVDGAYETAFKETLYVLGQGRFHGYLNTEDNDLAPYDFAASWEIESLRP